eukprot:11183327-Alexandrium_andersonii.AAC.1
MSASLVGSEMCIRDSGFSDVSVAFGCFRPLAESALKRQQLPNAVRHGKPVSYTHLTLPTICSV